MGRVAKDAKDLLIGKDGSEKEPESFKEELDKSIKNGVITKAEGTLMVTSRMNVDKLGEKIDKKQIDGVKKIKDKELYDSAEEEKEAIKEKEKKEKERKRKEKEVQVALEQASKSKNKENEEVKKKEKELVRKRKR